MCGNSSILSIIYYVKIITDTIMIIVPILLILLFAIDIGKMVMIILRILI